MKAMTGSSAAELEGCWPDVGQQRQKSEEDSLELARVSKVKK